MSPTVILKRETVAIAENVLRSGGRAEPPGDPN